jgi:hypothetical protein
MTVKDLPALAFLAVVVIGGAWVWRQITLYLMSRPDLQTRLRLQRRREWQKQHHARLRK